MGHISTHVPWWNCKAATVLAGVLRPLVSTQDVHARDALSDTGCSTKRKGTQGGILDQDVIHYDTWLRKHSQYAFTRLSAKMFEIKSTRKLEQVISTGVHPKQHKEKRENKNPEIPFLWFETTAIYIILGL